MHWVATGQVNPNDLFYRDGMRVAVPAHAVEPFAAYFRAAAFSTGGLAVATPKLGDDPAMRWILPVGRSGWAIAAGYLGLFSVLGVFGPFAIVTA